MLMLLPALCPRAWVLMRGVMVVMGTMLPLGVDVEEVVVRPSLISMVKKVFMSGSSSPWVTCCPAALPGVRSSFELLEACTSFSAGCLDPPLEFCHWPAEDRGLLATPLGWGATWLWDAAEVWDIESTCGLAGLSPDVLRDAAVCVSCSVALERFVWLPLPKVVPFFTGAFFKAGTLELWLDSVNLRIRSRTELVRLNCSSITPFFSGALKTECRMGVKITKNKTQTHSSRDTETWSLPLFRLNLAHLWSLALIISFSTSKALYKSHSPFLPLPGFFLPAASFCLT